MFNKSNLNCVAYRIQEQIDCWNERLDKLESEKTYLSADYYDKCKTAYTYYKGALEEELDVTNNLIEDFKDYD